MRMKFANKTVSGGTQCWGMVPYYGETIFNIFGCDWDHQMWRGQSRALDSQIQYVIVKY